MHIVNNRYKFKSLANATRFAVVKYGVDFIIVSRS